jgi:hypothetical protein
MKVRRIDRNGDWTFGQGLSNYISRSEGVRQNVITRLKSFKNDWFLDVEANIDWYNILSNKNNEQTILREIERITLATEGVQTITNLEVVSVNNKREARIHLSFTTIYDTSFDEQIEIGILE